MLKKIIYNFLKIVPDSLFIKIKYLLKLRKILNLKKPKTFNEKIQWLKLNDRTPLHTLCADKLKVRDFLKEKIGEEYLIPLVLATKNVEDITPNNLPDYPFIIKTNHDSGTYFIVKDKTKQNWEEIRRKLITALKSNFYYNGREWQYKNIEPHIVVEKLLQTKSNKVPNDLKFHCFNGEVKFIQVDIDRQEKHTRSMFDSDWKLLNFSYHYKKGTKVSRPKKIEKMLQLSNEISKNFIFARVDFYEIEEEIYFGEITFHPESGFGVFSPESKNLEYGNMINIKL